MAAKRKSSARSRAKTKVACERAGGKPVHFKGMKKGEVICFPKSKKSSTKKRKTSTKRKAGTRKQTAKQRAASMRNLKKARAALKRR